MRKYLRGNSGMRFLAILTAVALTLGSVDVTALASAAGQNAAEQTAVEPKNTEGRAAVSGETEGQDEPENDGDQPGGNENTKPGSAPKQNTDAPEDNETPADPEGTGETSADPEGTDETSGQYNNDLYGTDYASEPYEVQVGESETHYMCGYTGTSWDEHKKLHPACGWRYNIYTFTPWNRTDSLPTEAGNYYLVNDVELTETWNVPAGWTYLCLSGKSITMKGNGAAISVSTKGKLHLTDCKEADNRITHAEGYEGSGIAISGSGSNGDDKGKVYLYNRNLLGGLYRENPVKSRNYEAVKSSKKWENVGNSYIIPALLLYRYSYI